MKAYRVFNLAIFGHEDEVKYYLDPIRAEKEFHARVRDCIKKLPLAKQEDLSDSKPWDVKTNKHPVYKNSKLHAAFRFWAEHRYADGTEFDIDDWEIVFEEIEMIA